MVRIKNEFEWYAQGDDNVFSSLQSYDGMRSKLIYLCVWTAEYCNDVTNGFKKKGKNVRIFFE